MKTPTPFKPLLLLVLLVAAGGFSQQAMAQEKDTCVVAHIHTYMNGQLVPWDSLRVYVKDDNHYHYHIFWMYYPDTIMANCPLDTHEYSSDVVFSLSSAYPNPCLGESNVRLTNQEAGNVNLSIVDMQGHLCCQKNMNLTAGEHLLSVTLPHNGLYFLKAESRQGNEVCKVLCAEGKGGEFDIGLASSSFLSKEKKSKGGEGLFSMRKKMGLTVYLTYNGRVWSKVIAVNDTFDDDVYISEWLYPYGSVNIYFWESDTCQDFSLSGQTYDIVPYWNYCLPFVDYPLGCVVTFYDSTFYAVPGPHFQQLSSWQYDGWYKYRYIPNQNNTHNFFICTMDEMLPEENDRRRLDVESCDVHLISLYSGMQGSFNYDLLFRRR